MYKEKYLKYKTKYITLKNQLGGGFIEEDNVDDFRFTYNDENGTFSIVDDKQNEVYVDFITENITVKLNNNTNIITFKSDNESIKSSLPNIIKMATDRNIVKALISKSINIVLKYIPANYPDFEKESLENLSSILTLFQENLKYLIIEGDKVTESPKLVKSFKTLEKKSNETYEINKFEPNKIF